MEENTQLQDFFNSLGFSDEDAEEVNQYSYATEGCIDDAIESFKELEADEQRFLEIYVEKTQKLKYEFDCKKNRITKKKEWLLFNIKNSVMASKDKKDLKTMYKKAYLSGEVQITKSKINLIKPELTEEELLANFPAYAKPTTKVALDWKTLKSEIAIVGGKVIHVATGEDLSTLISTETTSESITIK